MRRLPGERRRSSSPASARGWTTSLPIDLHEPCVLSVNAACDADRPIRVAIVGAETGEPLPGRALADCHPLVGDDIAHTVSWRGEATIAVARPVRIHLELAGDADLLRLYAYTLQPI